jgi:5-methylcytosine-specific restriction endonuclease McrA
MGFPASVVEKALLWCGRHCCVCHKFCGVKIELHHIVAKADGGEDTFDNCIPLCFDCHADVMAYNPRHPKGRKYTGSELKAHRDRWYEVIAKQARRATSAKEEICQSLRGTSDSPFK